VDDFSLVLLCRQQKNFEGALDAVKKYYIQRSVRNFNNAVLPQEVSVLCNNNGCSPTMILLLIFTSFNVHYEIIASIYFDRESYSSIN
jgi:hypothetical protein